MRILLLLLLLLAPPALADTVAPLRNIRAQSVIAAEDLLLLDRPAQGALDDPALAIGMEARKTLFANRPIRPEDIGPPALIDRNQIVPLSFTTAELRIQTEGRALARGGAGDIIRIMNLTSRSTVTGRILADGSVIVGPAH